MKIIFLFLISLSQIKMAENGQDDDGDYDDGDDYGDDDDDYGGDQGGYDDGQVREAED